MRCAHKPPTIYGSLKFLEAFPPGGSATQAGLAAKRRSRPSIVEQNYNCGMGGLGRVLILAGVVLLALGMVLLLVDRANLPLGRLPGDITYRGKNTVVFFPLTTSIILSVVLSIILYFISRMRH